MIGVICLDKLQFMNIHQNTSKSRKSESNQSEISRGLFNKSNRVNVDVRLTQYANRHVADNREVVRAIVEVLHFAARQNIPLRDHSECQSSLNRGNFIEMLKVIAHHNIPLIVHL